MMNPIPRRIKQRPWEHARAELIDAEGTILFCDNDSKKKLTELKINSIFQKINDALISDFNNLDIGC